MLRKTSGTYLAGFGYWNGQLYIADRHHADILEHLVEDKGVSWEQLLENPPIFGWLQHTDYEYNVDTGDNNDIPRSQENPITVKFATDTGAPKPDDQQTQQVLKAVEEYFKAPAVVGEVNMGLWDVGSEGYGTDSYEYNLNTQRELQHTNPEGIEEGDRVETRDGVGTVIEVDTSDPNYPYYIDVPDYGPDWYKNVKKVGAGAVKWMYSPDYDRYQEWSGPMSHVEVAKDIWQADLDTWKNMWGGLKHPNGTVQIGWWPMEIGTEEYEAKRAAPLGLLAHLNKNS